MSLAITQIDLKTPVNVNEKFVVSVRIMETTPEPVAYRLAFKLGQPKGNAKITGSGTT